MKSALYIRRCFLMFVAAACLFSQAEGAVYRVKPGGTGDGSSWEKALGEQGFASTLAEAGPGNEFWVVSGTYRPVVVSQDVASHASGRNTPAAASSRERSFLVKGGVSLYGGFAGDETARDQRKWEENTTILSGLMDTDEGYVNSYHVLLVSGDVGGSPVIDGFTITGGRADGTADKSRGGGMYISGSSPRITNCTFSLNSAVNGGALYAAESAPLIRDSKFSYNEATFGGGIFAETSSLSLVDTLFSYNQAQSGGGIFFQGPSGNGGAARAQSPASTIEKCTFSRNMAIEAGGAMVNWEYSPKITDSSFLSNRASTDGGALFNHKSTPSIQKSTFAENSANRGGAVANWDSSPIVVNCTFSENRAAEYGGALLNDASSPIVVNTTFRANRASMGGAMFNVAGSPVIANSILWGNGTEVRMEGGTTTITYSVVEGGFSGEGNIDRDPRLAGLANNGGDTHTCALDEESPAIDAGLTVGTRVAGVIQVPALDQRGISRPRGSGVDMGAFEYYDPNDPAPTHGGGGSGGCRTTAGSAVFATLLLPLLLLRRKRA